MANHFSISSRHRGITNHESRRHQGSKAKQGRVGWLAGGVADSAGLFLTPAIFLCPFEFCVGHVGRFNFAVRQERAPAFGLELVVFVLLSSG